MRRFTLPAHAPGSVGDMIRLRAEADAPSAFRPCEVAYRSIGTDTDEGQTRFEVCIARAHDIESASVAAKERGQAVCAMVPTAWLWAIASRRATAGKIWATERPDGAWEYCAQSTADQAHVAFHGANHTPDEAEEAATEVALAARLDGPSPSKLMAAPPDASSGVVHADTDEALGIEKIPWEALELATGGLSEMLSAGGSAAGFSPGADRATALTRRRIRRTVVALASFAGAFGAVVGGFSISSERNIAETERLLESSAGIRVAGRAVEHRLEQLGVVAETRTTRGHFARVLVGLHRASPAEGLSFSRIELQRDGKVVLRGQADALSLPFQLPERLEADRAFADVVLTDAGQSRRGRGTVSEFSAEARLDERSVKR
ncbi:MAG: hypothetical protein AAGG07_05940 [Planctomycetota bacterium]